MACGLARITYLSLPGNNLVGTVPAATYSAWPNLTIANLANNEISGTLPSQLGGLHSVHELTLQHTLLSGSIPSEIGMATSMLKAPSWWCHGLLPGLPGLQGFGRRFLYALQRSAPPAQAPVAAYDAAVSPVPASLIVHLSTSQVGQLGLNTYTGSGTSVLGLGTTLLSGSLPTEIALLKDELRYLDLKHLQLDGTLPAGPFPELQVLNLEYSRLSGILSPTTVDGLPKIRSIRISASSISGTIPTELGRADLQVPSRTRIHLSSYIYTPILVYTL